MRWQIISDEGLKKRPDFRLHIRSIPNIISLHHKLFLMAIGMYIGTYIYVELAYILCHDLFQFRCNYSTLHSEC